jgi:hypothetical protein
MELLQMNIIEIICKTKRIFPPSFLDSMEHLTIHLPYEAKVGGLVQYIYQHMALTLILKMVNSTSLLLKGSILNFLMCGQIMSLLNLETNIVFNLF